MSDNTPDFKNKIILKLKEYSDILTKRHDKELEWFKNILTMSIGLFGILVALKSDTNDTNCQEILFIITICTLGLGILCGVIYLYSAIAILDLHLTSKKEYIQELNEGKDKNVLKILDVNWFFYLCKYLFLLMFLVSLISISLYSVLSNI